MTQLPSVPDTAPPDFSPRKPRTALPPLACDCHAHICGPKARHPYYERRIYTPADALLPDYRHMLATLGVERAVLVQGSIYGTDNTVLLEALRTAGPQFRGVAVVPWDIDERELLQLHETGVRGVRVNIVDTRDAKGVLPVAQLTRFAERLRPLGWHVEFLLHVDEFPDLDRQLDGFPVDAVFGHLGYMRTDKGVDHPGFKALLRLMRDGKAWAKLTAPYRISPRPMPHPDVTPYAHALLDAAPGRVVWGSDWPHVKAEWAIPMPNDGDIADLLPDWIPDAALRARVLADNPARLYGFGRAG